MASGGLHSLATIIKRLEAATSRLEDLSVAGQQQQQHQQGVQPVQPAQSTQQDTNTTHSTANASPSQIRAFDNQVITQRLEPFVKLSDALGPPVSQQAALVKSQILSLRTFLLTTTACQKPSQAAFAEMLNPLKSEIEQIVKLKDQNRNSKEWADHLTTVAEGASFVGWVTVDTKPHNAISEQKDAAQYYANRVIKLHKDKEDGAKHVEWVRSYIGILEETKKFVLENYPSGLTWNPQGIKVEDYKPPNTSTTPAADTGAPPPPPPPPPPPTLPDGSIVPPPAAATSTNPTTALLADLNRGASVTSHLKKVDRAALKSATPVPVQAPLIRQSSSPGVVPKRPLKPAALAGKKPSKFALEGNKWLIEHVENDTSLVLEESKTEISHVVSLFGCKNVTIQIKGKVNAISMLNCTKTSVLTSNVISQISITRSPSFAVQITKDCFAPTIQIDSTDSGIVYLSKKCVEQESEIVTAKCSSINISVPQDGDDGEEGFSEKPVPEMLRSVVKDGNLVTSIVEHSA